VARAGGFDETSYLSDVWELHLTRLQLNASKALREAHCDWRKLSNATWTACLRVGEGTAASVADPMCNLEEVVVQAWCSDRVQAFNDFDAFFGAHGVPDENTGTTSRPIVTDWQ